MRDQEFEVFKARSAQLEARLREMEDARDQDRQEFNTQIEDLGTSEDWICCLCLYYCRRAPSLSGNYL